MNPQYEAMIRQELSAVGLEPSFGHGGKHPYVSWEQAGQTRKMAFPSTPSDQRSLLNSRSELRRMIATGEHDEPEPTAVVVVRDGRALCSSRDIADAFHREHSSVLRAIRNMECSDEFRRNNFAAFKINDLTGETTSHVEMTRDGFSFLVMGFTGKRAARWKEQYIAAFNAMERQIRMLPEARLMAKIEDMQSQIDHLKGEVEATTQLLFDARKPVETIVITKIKRPYVPRRLRRLN